MMSHSGNEGMLLRSHASRRSVARVVGRRFAGKSTPKGDISGVSQTRDPGIQPRGRYRIDSGEAGRSRRPGQEH